MGKAGNQSPNSVDLQISLEQVARFHPLMQEGFMIRAEIGCTIKTLLCDQFKVSPDYLETRVQTVFLNGKPVDDLESAEIPAEATVALSAAMPGLVGATLRRGGYYAPMRSAITYRKDEAQGARGQGMGMVRIKLFNLVGPELAPSFLARGIWLSGSRLQKFFSQLPREFWTQCKAIHLDGNAISATALRRVVWPDDSEPVRLSVRVAE
jgi:hypothetical protein